MGFDRSERGNGGVCVCLVLLACGTAFDIFVHKLCKAQPPEFRGDKLVGLEVTRVTGGLMVMAVGKDGATEGILWGNVDMILVCQDVIIEFPVREVRPEGSRDVLQGRLQMLEDEGV